MQRNIRLLDDQNHSLGTIKITLPNYCPWCHSKISPSIASQTRYDDSNRESPISLVLLCPSCYNHFLQTYKVIFDRNWQITNLEMSNEKPMPKTSFAYPSKIDSISEEFGKIITESSNAEGLGFNHLAGIGYRKALEFLVKDYLIKLESEDSAKISKLPLSQCIAKIKDSRMNDLALAATWIGNDETHYVRKHTDKDIEDLKKFLHTLTNLVNFEISISEANDFINNN
ncbi:DUF4145 domain-containing protein [Staphylococcus shinii]|uniref:DUF4145 domain-containing protein n=1 Tax=Staphylococcus shinii TaxID=2912228 RepID=UPI00298EDF6B|nr:DUF4145 domain-containing protein [Staphylococcus shinii]MDW8571190.1 DUF4145 domain-containing protein [Staphylococcus shinii]MDW8572905.1 DUF4145 domain-containing protein [Staphylococcus shinii]